MRRGLVAERAAPNLQRQPEQQARQCQGRAEQQQGRSRAPPGPSSQAAGPGPSRPGRAARGPNRGGRAEQGAGRERAVGCRASGASRAGIAWRSGLRGRGTPRRIIHFHRGRRLGSASSRAAGESRESRPRGPTCARGRSDAVPREPGGAPRPELPGSGPPHPRGISAALGNMKGRAKGSLDSPSRPSPRPALPASKGCRENSRSRPAGEGTGVHSAPSGRGPSLGRSASYRSRRGTRCALLPPLPSPKSAGN